MLENSSGIRCQWIVGSVDVLGNLDVNFTVLLSQGFMGRGKKVGGE
jgi:hypothetical protein